MVLEDRSYGFVIFRINEGEIEFLLIKHKKGHWSFPKGHKNYGESEIEAATRELEEETGLKNIDIKDESISFEEKYNYNFKKKTIKKTVKYYLGQANTREIVRPDNYEVMEYTWCDFDKAKELITFDNTIEVLEDSNKIIKSLIQ